MNLKKYLIGAFFSVAVVMFSSGSVYALTSAPVARFNPQDPKAWAIIDYQAKQVVPKYKTSDATSNKRISDLKNTIHSLVMLSYTTEDTKYADKISVLARAQVLSEDSANKALDVAKKRSRVKKFFIGPDYTTLKTVKNEVKDTDARVASLKTMSTNLNSIPGRIILNQSLANFQKYDASLKDQLKKSESGFSLFGWFSRLVKKY